MSLKDRLNTSNKNSIQDEQEPRYYESDIIAKQITLGVLDEILIDSDINAIYVNDSKNIYIQKRGIVYKSSKSFRDNVQLLNMIKKNAKDTGLELSENNPYITFMHKPGIKVSATIPPLSSNVCVYVKCYQDKFASLQAIEEQNIISKETSLVLEVLLGLKNNIIIAGETCSLKTTFLAALAKKASSKNSRNILIDYSEELKVNSSNFSNYDFSILNKNAQFDLLNVLTSSNFDRLLINDAPADIISYLIKKIQDGFEGLIVNIKAKDKKEAINKLTHILLKDCPYLSFDKAKEIVCNSFNILLFTKSDKEGKRLDTLSQIRNNVIEDIFFSKFKEFHSTGTIPEFYQQIKSISPLNANIFDRDYKHTLFKLESFSLEAYNKTKKESFEQAPVEKTDESEPKTTPDEVSIDEMEIDETNMEIEEQKTSDESELIKKARDKFSEIKKNAKLQESLKNDENL